MIMKAIVFGKNIEPIFKKTGNILLEEVRSSEIPHL